MSNEKELSKIIKMLQDHEKRITEIEKKLKGFKEPEVEMMVSDTLRFDMLAKRTGVDEEKIKKVFDYDDGKITILKVIGESEKEKTQNVSLLVLLGYKYLLCVNKILSQEIKRNVAENRIPVNNFATHLNELSPSLIRRRGKARSPKTTYRLTTLGDANAREILKRITEER